MNPKLQEGWDGFTGEVRLHEPLSKHTTYRIGGPASVLVIPKSKEDLSIISKVHQTSGSKVFTLGAGSNVLASDEGYDGIVVKTSKLNLVIESKDQMQVHAGCSVSISTLLNRAAHAGWDGLGFLAGIPGTVGGVSFMNGGTHLGESKDVIRKVSVFSLRTGVWRDIERDQLHYSYRENHFLEPEDLVYETVFQVKPGDPALIKKEIDGILVRRKATQPLEAPSCGSVFRNPPGARAWEVVDQLGLRGHASGGAKFSEMHPNWILNIGNAKASDVRALIELAKTRAKKELGIDLKEEVRFL